MLSIFSSFKIHLYYIFYNQSVIYFVHFTIGFLDLLICRRSLCIRKIALPEKHERNEESRIGKGKDWNKEGLMLLAVRKLLREGESIQQ